MTLDNDRIQEIFDAAKAIPRENQSAFLDGACGDDESLRSEVESLLDHAGQGGVHAATMEGTAAKRSPLGVSVDPNIGRRIDRYVIRSLIGEGGFGLVYLADQVDPIKREVAIKLIKPGMDSKAVLARFDSERQALALMDHSGIAKILDGGVADDGRPFFVMEYVRGISITSFCDENRLVIRDRLELFMEVCRAVRHAHSKGVIHRDLKPTNILAGFDGASAVVKIIDFGIAKALNQQLTAATLVTDAGHLIGTPEYMSPEQAQHNALEVDVRTDVYSLGVVLYELLSGSLPFEPSELRSAGIDEIKRILKEDDPPRPSLRFDSLCTDSSDDSKKVAKSRAVDPKRLERRLRGDLDWIVMKCLEKTRPRRYQTADALVADIHRFLNDEPVEAGPPSLRYRFGKFARRHTTSVAVSALILILLIGGVVSSTIFAVRAERSRQVAEDRKAIVLDLAVNTMNDLYKQVSLLDGTIKIRQTIIDASQAALDQLDPGQVHAVSIADKHYQRGMVLGGLRSGNLGDQPAARSAFEKAKSLLATVVERDPEQYDALLSLIRATQGIGDTWKAEEQWDKARFHYAECRQLLPSDTDDPTLAALDISLLQSLTDLMEQDPQKQLSLTIEMIPLRRRMLDGDPEDETLQRDYANTLSRAGVRSLQDDQESAAGWLLEASRIRQALADGNPNNNTYRRDLAWSAYSLGQLAAAAQDSHASLDHYGRALKLLAVCIRNSPDDARSRKNMGEMLDDFDSREIRLHNASLEAVLLELKRVPEQLPAVQRALDAYRSRIQSQLKQN